MLFIITTGIFIISTIFLLWQNLIFRRYGINIIKSASKSKKPLLLLESPTGFHAVVPKTMYDNCAFTEQRDVILIPAGTLKPCPQLGNIQVGHGELYLSAMIPLDLKRFVDSLREKDKSEDEIIKGIEDLMTGKKNIPKTVELPEKERCKVYKTINYSNLSSFLSTGMNRTLLKRQILNLIWQNKLTQMFGGSNWMKILVIVFVAFFVVIIGFVMLKNAGLLDPAIVQSAVTTATATGTGRISP